MWNAKGGEDTIRPYQGLLLVCTEKPPVEPWGLVLIGFGKWTRFFGYPSRKRPPNWLGPSPVGNARKSSPPASPHDDDGMGWDGMGWDETWRVSRTHACCLRGGPRPRHAWAWPDTYADGPL